MSFKQGIKSVSHKSLMSSISFKLKMSVNKITIKIMEKQSFVWNKICPIHINKKTLEL